MNARTSSAEARQAQDVDVIAAAIYRTALSLRRLLTGEVTPPVHAPRLRSVETPGQSPTAGIALLRLWCVGEVPEALRGVAQAEAVPSVDEVSSRLTVERAPDAIVVRSPAEAEALRQATSRPVVVEGPELRARVRLAVAAALTQQMGGRGGW